MKQMMFETRQKAEELLQEALAIWRQSDQADFLEDIEKDPVFSLLMMALAYQSNELDSEVERLKSEVLEDFARLLIPYEAGHAMPATAVVGTTLQDEVAELAVGENTVFRLDGEHPFLPLLETRALNADVRSIVRMDGRRWKVSLHFRYPVSDLSGFAFVIKDTNFQDVSLSVKGHVLPLIRPWQYSELPLSPCFAPDAMTYNLGHMCNLSTLPLDLFARHNVRYYCIAPHSARKYIPLETEQLDLIFEFTGIPDNWVFDKGSLVLNPVLLVNAQVGEVTLSAHNPVARISGGQEDRNLSSRQFLHLVRPSDNQLFGNMELEVRGVAGDRFNQGSLLRLLNSIITKYHSDFYAYYQLKGVMADNAVYQIESALSQLREETVKDALSNVSGVYLMPRSALSTQKKDFSLNVRYLTTAGASINGLLGLSSSFTAPSGFMSSRTTVIALPIPGTDEIHDDAALDGMLRYYMVTSDRIVTMADLKAFCRKELMVRYGIGSPVIRRFTVNRRLQQETTGCGYEIVAEIALAGTSFVKRSLQDKLPVAEILLQKMIEVRSTNIYPIRVSITIEEE